MSTPKPPEILDKIVDVVLAHRPKPKTNAAAKRKRAMKKAAKRPAKPPVESATDRIQE
jgi:hypothetical protein